MQAMPQAQAFLSSFQLNEELPLPAPHSAVSSLFWPPPKNGSKHITRISQLPKLTISPTVMLSPPSLPQLPPVPQQPNHMVCHIMLWLVGVVPFSTNRKVSTHSKCDINVCEKARRKLFIRNLIFTWPINTIEKLVCSLKSAPTHTSEMRLTEAASCCYVILN